MIFKAGFLAMVLLKIMAMMQGFDARQIQKMGNSRLFCKPKELASLTKRQVEMTLTLFNEANGQDLGTWPPGFPALKVEQSSSISVDKVQCSLLFLTHGLEKILEDQRDNLNPEDVPLHRALKESGSRVGHLAACLRGAQGGTCSSPPAPPQMPPHTFEKKQWSHTLLTAATHYLHWLQLRLKKGWTIHIKHKHFRPKHRAYTEGSGYLL